jgi:HD-GYP domain-containing protein (c-di-GMP phosphodiesterase class II)
MGDTIDVGALRAGERLSRALYTRHGAKLAARGSELTAEQLMRLRRNGAALSVGYPVGGRRAEGAGQETAPEPAPILARIETGGSVVEATSARRKSLREAERIAGERAARWSALPLRVERGGEPVVSAAALREAADWPLCVPAPDRWRAGVVDRCRSMLERVASGAPVDVEEPLGLVEELLALLSAAPQRFGALARIVEDGSDYLPAHAASCCVASMATGARLGWGETDVRIVGIAGLFADCGMSVFPASLRLNDGPLDEVLLNRVRRHPAMSVAMLDVVRGAPAAALRAVLQHHEREDGSGYPFGLRSRGISDHARVVAVADAYCAASGARAHRLTVKRPHDAMKEVIRGGAAGLFDREAARALACAIGLFPVGSHVRLTDGRRAVVEAANWERTERPIVRTVAAGPRLAQPGETIDLDVAADWDVAIAGPADAPLRYAAAA